MRFLAAIFFLLLALLPAQAQQGLSQALVVSSCGAPTLTVGGQVQATMDTTGRLCSHKTGSGVSPPVISVAPVASGSLTVGSTLSCTTGTWTNSPTSYAYTWLRGGSAISGATSASYVTVTADGGTSVGCSVIASNAGGNSSPSASNTLAISGGVTASTWSTTDAAANGVTLSNGNRTLNPPYPGGGAWASTRTTKSLTSGKAYVELYFSGGASVGGGLGIGLADATASSVNYPGFNGHAFGLFGNSTSVPTAGFTVNYNVTGTLALGDVWGIAVDFAAGKFWLAQNNVWQGSGNPATGTTPMVTISSPALGLAYFPALGASTSNGANTSTWTLQGSPANQTYAPPAGFTAWDGL